MITDEQTNKVYFSEHLTAYKCWRNIESALIEHNVPFGSSAHREMNFIDMLIEYQEEIEIKRMRIQAMRKEEEESMGDEAENVVHMTQQEIDDEYDKLDLENLQ